MPYICIIDTSNYRNRRCSKKNWEPGTVNDYVHALNGWHHVEPDRQALRWRLMMFQGGEPYDPEVFGSEAYQAWYNQTCNKVEYQDRLCGIVRTANICPPGWKQGPAFNLDAMLNAVDRDGSLEIPFARVYDVRQYDEHMNGCVLRIVKDDAYNELPEDKDKNGED